MFAEWHMLDIFFLILACYFVIKGCFRGFVGEILTLVGFLVSIYVSFKFSGTIGNMLERSTGINIYLAQFVSILLVWFVITLLAALLRKTLKSVISVVNMGGMDKLLGVFSGLLKSVIVVYIVLIFGFLLSPITKPTWMTSSDVLRYSGRHWPSVRQILIDYNFFPQASNLPDGTLEQIVRPYRTGVGSPKKNEEN